MSTVGVVIAAHNSEATIAEALRSLLNQDHSDWQAVIVDDASTDNTIAEIEPFLADTRFRLLRNQENLGSGASRNLALQALDTELVAVLDADDICRPTRLSRQSQAFEQNPALTVLGAQVAEFGEWGGPEVSKRWPVTHAEIADSLASRMSVAHCAVMYRRLDVLSAGGYDARLRRAQDLALMLRLTNANFAALESVEVLYRTERPISLGYAIRSGRGGYLARYWHQAGDDAPLPSSWRLRLVDGRSIITWARRAMKERMGSLPSPGAIRGDR